MDLGTTLRKHLEQLIEQAGEAGSRNVAAATNVSTSGHHTSVYSDQQVTIVQRDGETQVIRHDEEAPAEPEKEGEAS